MISTTKNPLHDYNPSYAMQGSGLNWFDKVTGVISKGAETAMETFELYDRYKGREDAARVQTVFPTGQNDPESAPAREPAVTATEPMIAGMPRDQVFLIGGLTVVGLLTLALLMQSRK